MLQPENIMSDAEVKRKYKIYLRLCKAANVDPDKGANTSRDIQSLVNLLLMESIAYRNFMDAIAVISDLRPDIKLDPELSDTERDSRINKLAIALTLEDFYNALVITR